MRSEYVHWTTKEVEWLGKMYGLHDNRTITELHNRIFPPRTYEAIKKRASTYYDRTTVKYTQRQLEWMVEHRHLDKSAFGKAFRLRFKSNKSDDALRQKMLRTCRMLVI